MVRRHGNQDVGVGVLLVLHVLACLTEAGITPLEAVRLRL
jgi:hypothetical protein